MSNPLIISCPVVGAELTRDVYPHLPLTPEEIANASAEAVEAGASIIHLHVRDENGQPTQSVEVFEETSRRIKERCDCILQYSTGGAVGTPLQERIAPLKLKPDMATLSMGTLNFGDSVFENTQAIIRGIADEIRNQNITAELEIFDAGMLDSLPRYQKNGWLPPHYHLDFVLGVPGGMSGDIFSLNHLVSRLKPEQTWSVAGVGRFQLPLSMHAIAMGGHVRVGIEDNIFYRKGQIATSNAELVQRIADIGRLADRAPATVAQTRELLGIER